MIHTKNLKCKEFRRIWTFWFRAELLGQNQNRNDIHVLICVKNKIFHAQIKYEEACSDFIRENFRIFCITVKYLDVGNVSKICQNAITKTQAF